MYGRVAVWERVSQAESLRYITVTLFRFSQVAKYASQALRFARPLRNFARVWTYACIGVPAGPPKSSMQL